MARANRVRTNFTTIPNELIEDKEISLKAKGIYCIIANKHDGWEFIEECLVAESTDGRESFRTGVRELTQRGWLIRTQTRSEKNKFARSNYFLAQVRGELPTESNDENSDDVKPADGKPVDENSVGGKIVDEKSTPTNNNITKNNLTKNNQPPPYPQGGENETQLVLIPDEPIDQPKGPVIFPSGFETFWDAYPKKRGQPKSISYWKRLKLTERDLPVVMDGLERWKRSKDWTKNAGEFICWPQKFLINRMWETPPDMDKVGNDSRDVTALSNKLERMMNHG